MLIGQLAQHVGLSRDTIRFYEKNHFIQSITRNNGYKDYPEHSIQQIQLIKTAKMLGFSLAEIKQMLQLMQQGDIPSGHVQQTIQQKINVLDEKIERLHDIRRMLINLSIGEDCPLRNHCTLPDLA
jgi:DNA-binding transcriptional MerR regulator